MKYLRFVKNALTFILGLLLCSCSGPPQAEKKSGTDSSAKMARLPIMQASENIQDNNTPAYDYSIAANYKQTLFVINDNGSNVYKQPDESSEIEAGAVFGHLAFIYSDTLQWYKVTIPVENYYKSGYMKKKDLAGDLKIPFTNEHLNYGSNNSEIAPRAQDIRIKLSSKSEYLDAIKMNDTTIDSSQVSKKNGVLSIRTKKGIKKFKDSPSDGPGEYYYFAGEAKPLNAYVVLDICQSCEDASWIVVHKETGADLGSVGAMPYFSNDGKLMITIEEKYEMYGEEDLEVFNTNVAQISFYQINNGSFKLLASKSYPLWNMGRSSKVLAGPDNSFYFGVLPSFANWENGHYNPNGEQRDGTDINYRYVKVNLLGK